MSSEAVGAGVFLGFEAKVGTERVGGVPKALFQRVSGRVLLRWRDPLHETQFFSSLETMRARVFEMGSAATKNGLAVLGAGRRLFQI
jgi:hypothetical protein